MYTSNKQGTISCKCGNQIMKDYSIPIIVSPDNTSMYIWKCLGCGQHYGEELKELIKI